MAREMKDSGIEWIGEIPAEWISAKAKYYMIVSNGSDPKTEGETPVYGSGAGSFKTCGEYKVGPCVLLGRKGATLHIPHYIDHNYWNVDTAFDVKTKNNFDLRFYYYLACCFDYKQYISQTTLPGMTQTSYENMFIPIPSFQEQKSIVAFLDCECLRIDAIIENTRASIEEYKKLKQAVITQAVTKGIRPDRPMKDSGVEWIGDIPIEWKVVQLKRIAKIQTGNTPTKTENNRYYSQDSGYLWIKAEDLGTTVPIVKTTEYLTDDGIRFGRLFPQNTIFVCCIASVGKVGYCNMAASCNQQINGLSFYDAYWKYGFYLTIAQESEYINNASGNVMKIINSDKQSKLKCPLPSIEEQREIADYIDMKCVQIDILIAKKEKTVEELEAYKKSLIYEYVTGKKEVPS